MPCERAESNTLTEREQQPTPTIWVEVPHFRFNSPLILNESHIPVLDRDTGPFSFQDSSWELLLSQLVLLHDFSGAATVPQFNT